MASISRYCQGHASTGKALQTFRSQQCRQCVLDRTRTGPLNGVHWDGIYTAEQIGSYKPNPKNYDHVVTRLEEDFGIQKDEILMVAQNLDIDHASAKALGFKPAVWIARKGAFMGGNREQLEADGVIELGAEFSTLGEMAEAVDKAFSGR